MSVNPPGFDRPGIVSSVQDSHSIPNGRSNAHGDRHAAASGVSHDLASKFEIYRRGGAREYLDWRVQNEEIDWFERKRKRSVKRKVEDFGILRSKVFPGLWLDASAPLRGDTFALKVALQRGLDSSPHTPSSSGG